MGEYRIASLYRRGASSRAPQAAGWTEVALESRSSNSEKVVSTRLPAAACGLQGPSWLRARSCRSLPSCCCRRLRRVVIFCRPQLCLLSHCACHTRSQQCTCTVTSFCLAASCSKFRATQYWELDQPRCFKQQVLGDGEQDQPRCEMQQISGYAYYAQSRAFLHPAFLHPPLHPIPIFLYFRFAMESVASRTNGKSLGRSFFARSCEQYPSSAVFAAGERLGGTTAWKK